MFLRFILTFAAKHDMTYQYKINITQRIA